MKDPHLTRAPSCRQPEQEWLGSSGRASSWRERESAHRPAPSLLLLLCKLLLLLLLCKLKTRSVPLRLSRPAPGLPSDSQFGKQAISHIVHPLLVCWCVPWISVCLLLTHTWPDTNLMESETNHSTERSNLNPQNSNWFRPQLLGSHNPRFLLLLG